MRYVVLVLVLAFIPACSIDSYDGDGARAICQEVKNEAKRDACFAEAAEQAAVREVGRAKLQRTKVGSVPCIVAETAQGVALNCDWSRED